MQRALVQNADGTFSLEKEAFLAGIVGYEPRSRRVLAFHQSTAHTRIVSAPARTSKSYSTGYEALWFALPEFAKTEKGWRPARSARWSQDQKLIWIVGVDYRTIKEFDYIFHELVDRKLAYALGAKHVTGQNNKDQGRLFVKIDWGESAGGTPVTTTIEGKSAENYQSLQGEHLDLLILSEAAEIKSELWKRYLSTRYDYSIWPTTPKAKADWIRQTITAAEADPNLSVEHFQFTPHANPKYPWRNFWEEHARAESRVLGKSVTVPADREVPCSAENGHDCFEPWTECAAMRDESFGEQFGGQWTYESDRVLPFRWEGERSHVVRELPPWFEHARRYVSVDYGYADAAVALWAAVASDGTVLLYRELYEPKLASWDFADRIRRISEGARETVEWVVGDPQQPQMNEMLRRHELPVWGERNKAATRDRKAGHARIVDLLSDDPVLRRPLLYVHESCQRTIREWRTLRRKDGVQADVWEERAIVGDDHAYDACRYLLMSLPRRRAAEEGPAAMARYLREVEALRRAREARPERRLAGLAGLGAAA